MSTTDKEIKAKPNQAALKNKRRNKTPSHLKRLARRKLEKEAKEKEKLAEAEAQKSALEIKPVGEMTETQTSAAPLTLPQTTIEEKK